MESELQQGAQRERDSTRAKISRMIGDREDGIPAGDELATLLEWLRTRTKRFDRAPGGLGRKAK